MSAQRLLISLLDRFQPAAETVMLVSAVVTGLIVGTGVLLFRKLILLVQGFYWHDVAVTLSAYHPWLIAVVPVIGALVVSLLRLYLQTPDVKSDAVAKETGRLPYTQIPLKTVAAAMSLGAGASLGPEGPSVELGSNAGSWVGQLLGFSSDRTRLLLAAGGAAGLAAGFNAPIAGVFFALEVLLRDPFGRATVSIANTDSSAIALAAVISALIAQLGLGQQPAFNLPVYDVRSYWELPLYVGLGALASVVAIGFNRTLKFVRGFFNGELPEAAWVGNIPMPIKLVFGGVCVGLTTLVLPEAIGIGYETIESILQDAQFSIWLLVTLLIVKLGLTAISLGSGFVGGIFAPSLFLGAVLGSAYGQAIAALLPNTISAPPAYALAGMAAVLAGTVRAPLTSVLLLFEMTRDYRIVLPLMAAVGLCAWLNERLHAPKSYSLDMQVRNRSDETDVLDKIEIAEVMTRRPPTIKQSVPLLQAAQLLASGYHNSILIVDDQSRLAGIVTAQDLKRNLASTELSDRIPNVMVGDICTKELVSAFADESLATALKRMGIRDLRQLPVVDRQFPKRPIGIIEREAIATAYNTALTKRAIADTITANKTEGSKDTTIDLVAANPAAINPTAANPTAINSIDVDFVNVNSTSADLVATDLAVDLVAVNPTEERDTSNGKPTLPRVVSELRQPITTES